MVHYIGILLDDQRLEAIKGTGLENKLAYLFGGQVKQLIIEVPEEVSQKILAEFPNARIDSRSFLEDLPVAFRRALFQEVVNKKSLGADVVEAVFEKIDEIKELAAKESEYIPPPDIDTSDI
ncbi:hypothetical protein Asulf_02113 [Archaeoglobus sulfaticallidus PM70-1]|uniref:Uncharacterized protein n=1 Tax=Archaeoglobus sulfaticallidus PM70-1 TaxID=387631 RepID=N0BN79_9EURY|nr:hypothetical protein [Archaeoglobus sulfaticallidus]AGK62071.1 hypothetical protein Asulf_02113 [Archaeoglobus sulfaticallidus PM70-1]